MRTVKIIQFDKKRQKKTCTVNVQVKEVMIFHKISI